MTYNLKGRVITVEDSPTIYKVYQERRLHGVIRPSPKPVDGHFGIFVWDAYGIFRRMVGIAHSEQELPDKAYNSAKKYAEEIAKDCSCVLIDKTSKGDEKINQEQERRLQKSFLEQSVECDKRHQETLRSLRERGLDRGSYCVSGKPNSCADIGD